MPLASEKSDEASCATSHDKFSLQVDPILCDVDDLAGVVFIAATYHPARNLASAVLRASESVFPLPSTGNSQNTVLPFGQSIGLPTFP